MPAPYFTERLNAVADRGLVDVEAWFNVLRESNRSWEVDVSQWRFPARWIPERSLLGWRQHIPVAELHAKRPDMFIMEWHRVHLALAFPPALACSARTAARVLPTWDEVSHRTWWREYGKRWLFGSVDAAKGSRDGGRLAARYGLPADRFSFVPQSVDVAHYSRAHETTAVRRAEVRRRLALNGCVFVYAGRLVWEKGIDELLDAFAAVHASVPETTLLLIGDGRDEYGYRRRAEQIGGVRFAGFVQRDQLPELYACGDVFVFPTLGEPNGLVIDEALAAGLPIITTDAVGDIHHRVRDLLNGFVVPAHDAPALVQRMLRMATDPMLRKQLAQAASETVRDLDHEAYAVAFEQFVERSLALPPRHTLSNAFARALGRAMVALAGGSPPSPVMAPHSAVTAAATPVEFIRPARPPAHVIREAKRRG